MSLLEVAAALCGVIGVWLTVRENVWCWPVGLVNVGLYVFVFYEARLYADMGLQVVYVLLCLYGWYEWLHGGANRGVLKVSRAPAAAFFALAAAGVAFGAILGYGLRTRTDASLPYWDAGTTSFSLVAQYMLTRKWLENWVVWIAVDAVYVGIYLQKQLYPTAGLYAVFLYLAALGILEWRKTLAATARA